MAAIDLEPIRLAGRAVLAVRGMWCTSCAMALQRSLARVPGVRDVAVNFISGSALLRWDPASARLDEISSRADKLGYELSFMRDDESADEALGAQAQRIRFQLVVAVVFGMWSMLGAWVLYLDPGLNGSAEGNVIAWLSVAAGLPVMLYSGQDFFRAAFNTLRAGFAGMDALVSIGALGALLVSVWNLLAGSTEIYMDAATMLITFLLAGRLIEIHARQESGVTMRALARLAPEIASVVDERGAAEPRPISQVGAGDLVLVRAGERVPVDGVVVSGHSDVDLSLLTGESMPGRVGPADNVMAGTVNLGSPLQVKVVASHGARRIDLLGLRMLELFGARPSLSMAAERFVRWLFPIVSLVAAFSFLYYLSTGHPISNALISALSLFVAACPCAVGLSMPLAYALGAKRAAQSGTLWRDPASVEALAKSSTIAFDKTGTLTTGQLEIAGVEVAQGGHPAGVVRLAWQAEYGIVHPIADALRRHADRNGWRAEAAGASLAAQRHPRGVSFETDEGQVLVGARSWLQRLEVQFLPAGEDRPGVVHIARNGVWIGSIRFQDTLRAGVRSALKVLADEGVELWLLTGDSAAATEKLTAGMRVPFSRVLSGCGPDEKADALGQARGGVTFVGDGVNDVLALASAQCGVAVSSAAAVATSAAGIVITQGGAEQIASARSWARRTYRIMQQNLVFSISYNAVVVIALFASGATPLAAAVAMLLSSASVCLNALRLAQGPKQRPSQPRVASSVT
ncbi:heavy metal translocating P-type ATPase [Achromobacter pulmonis]|uniref:Heavy metal translocating P-type ATPase n=1 Tax=Achromobacter pulmonis TaxID=1389932 RepID=A0A2N8KH75_9BURK|nr:cation-translocating P-type ATPase [Achromobacter pulmonis]PND32800.1 heavy metal translocating P-type ATPase [Achromobacter pulmonis]